MPTAVFATTAAVAAIPTTKTPPTPSATFITH